MGTRDSMIQLAKQLEREGDSAFDLWSWLPSHHSAVKAHGDYFAEHQPFADMIMDEAILVFSLLQGSAPQESERQRIFDCPCGCGARDEKYLNGLLTSMSNGEDSP